jgi:hypothetical protein
VKSVLNNAVLVLSRLFAYPHQMTVYPQPTIYLTCENDGFLHLPLHLPINHFSSNTANLGYILNGVLNESSLCRGCDAGNEDEGHVLEIGSVEASNVKMLLSNGSKRPIQNNIKFDGI